MPQKTLPETERISETIVRTLTEMIPGETHEESGGGTAGPYVVILYNDDHHGFDEVILQVQKATGHPLERAIEITLEAHTHGRAIAYTGDHADCLRAARILRQIRLEVEIDQA